MPRPTIWHQILYLVLGLFCLALFAGGILLVLYGLLAPPSEHGKAMPVETLLLLVIAVLLVLILRKISKIEARTRERFPTEEEADYDWSQKDPMGHWEAHKDDAQKKS